jgi:hypothetical protein
MTDSFVQASVLLAGMLTVVLCPAPAPAAEVLLRDGSRHAGTLHLDGDKLRFEPEEFVLVALDDVRRIDFLAEPAPVGRLAAARRLQLPGGQHVSGELLGVSADRLTFRTGWASRLRLPRAGLALGPLPGWRAVALDSFDDGLRAWTVHGKPTVASVEKALYPHAVVLQSVEDSLGYALPSPLAEGRVGINFREQDGPAGAAWLLEAVFGTKEQTRRVRITVAGPQDHYRVQVEGLTGTAQTVKRTPGWHRLTLRFTATSLQVACDDAVLWYNLEKGPGLPLRKIELRCTLIENAEPTRGGVAWTAFCVERAVHETPRPPTDPEQDEVWLDTGDQLFGKILSADQRELSLQGRFGKQSIPWLRLQGCSFRRAEQAPAPLGVRVRLHLHSGLGPNADILDGVLRRLDERRLVLQHALLGELTIERAWVRSLEPGR